MATLYKRATKLQQAMLIMVEGAVINAMDAHQIPRDRKLARSIAKRAIETLTPLWGEVLASAVGQTSKTDAK